jgi:hypothetical protein
MKKIGKKLSGVTVALSLSLAAPMAAAMDIGVGASLNAGGGGTGSGISLPMRFGNIMIEPAVSIFDQTTDYSDSGVPDYSVSFKNYTLEAGIYWRKEVIPSVETYLGGRVGYIKRETSQTYPGSPSSRDESGYLIGPTFGAEYFFNKHFSMGLDVSLLYSSLSGDGESAGQPQSTSTENTYTQARTLLRFYF